MAQLLPTDTFLGSYVECSCIEWGLFRSCSFTCDTSKHGLLFIDLNGSGKTTLLKAMLTALTGVCPDRAEDIVRAGSLFAKVSCKDETGSESYVTFARHPQTGKFRTKKSIDKKNIHYFTYFTQYNHWLHFERSKKLALLDSLLSHTFAQSEYASLLSQLNKACKIKQTLISSYHKAYKQHASKHIPFTWQNIRDSDKVLLRRMNENIYSVSRKIWLARDMYFGFVISHCHVFQSLIQTPIRDIKMRRYSSNFSGQRTPFFDTTSPIDLDALDTLFLRECISGRGLFGAQRDDFIFEINGRDVTHYVSTGEMRLCVLFLIQLMIDVARIQDPHTEIWWFLDDVCNELDEVRERYVYEMLISHADFWVITGTKIPSFYERNASQIQLLSVPKSDVS